ncbi:MAG: hypothetical protein D4R81_01215 [Nitrospiraceae bacterium]|nr:MAG: hypothetical protein D4R81_01215 [Nitrospiraceae bacterium]
MTLPPNRPSDRNTSSPPRPQYSPERLRALYRLYTEFSSLTKTAAHVGLSVERVRQLLEKGTTQGLFNYRSASKHLDYKVHRLQTLSPTALLALAPQACGFTDLMTSLRLPHRASAAFFTAEQRRACRQAWLDRRLAKRTQRAIARYLALQTRLGYAPCMTDIQRYDTRLNSIIACTWKHMATFLAHCQLPTPVNKRHLKARQNRAHVQATLLATLRTRPIPAQDVRNLRKAILDDGIALGWVTKERIGRRVWYRLQSIAVPATLALPTPFVTRDGLESGGEVRPLLPSHTA